MVVQIPDDAKSDLLVRLRRIEGQVGGIQRMLEADRDCQDVLQQLSAVHSALHNASLAFARRYALHCIHHMDGGVTDEQLVDQLLAVVGKV